MPRQAQEFNIPVVIKNWVQEIRNKEVPVWVRDNTAIRLAELSELIDTEIKKFEIERDKHKK